MLKYSKSHKCTVYKEYFFFKYISIFLLIQCKNTEKVTLSCLFLMY